MGSGTTEIFTIKTDLLCRDTTDLGSIPKVGISTDSIQWTETGKISSNFLYYFSIFALLFVLFFFLSLNQALCLWSIHLLQQSHAAKLS